MTTMACMTLVFAMLIGSFWCKTGSMVLQDSDSNTSDGQPKPSYYGCFDGSGEPFPEFGTSILDTQNDNTKCQKFCLDEGYFFCATHGEICGCFRQSPLREFSGPKHRGITFKVPNIHSQKCSTNCPGGSNGGQCQGMEKHCCGGPEAYSVYIVGGLHNCITWHLKELEKMGVNLTASHIPRVCLPVNAKKRDLTFLQQLRTNKRLQKRSKQRNEEPLSPKRAKRFFTVETKEQRKRRWEASNEAWKTKYHPLIGTPGGIGSCCSPKCDWLIEFHKMHPSQMICD